MVFARLVGTDQSTVSKYEAGKIAPSRSTLLNILRLAEGDAERNPILEALGVENPADLGMPQSEVDQAIEDFETYLKQGGSAANKDGSKKRFIDLVRLTLDSEIDPAITGILAKWVKHRHDKAARKFFRNLDVYLDVELKASGKVRD